MSGPRRVQRRRTAGWRMPPGAVYVGRPTRWGNRHSVGKGDRSTAVERFRAELLADSAAVEAVRAELRGRDLACWCRPGEPCHADVLLEVANAPRTWPVGRDGDGAPVWPVVAGQLDLLDSGCADG